MLLTPWKENHAARKTMLLIPIERKPCCLPPWKEKHDKKKGVAEDHAARFFLVAAGCCPDPCPGKQRRKRVFPLPLFLVFTMCALLKILRPCFVGGQYAEKMRQPKKRTRLFEVCAESLLKEPVFTTFAPRNGFVEKIFFFLLKK